ncbi:MAG: hypothetical protein ACI4OV_05990, partial [Victivallaceae bacterium]
RKIVYLSKNAATISSLSVKYPKMWFHLLVPIVTNNKQFPKKKPRVIMVELSVVHIVKKYIQVISSL